MLQCQRNVKCYEIYLSVEFNVSYMFGVHLGCDGFIHVEIND